MGLLGLPGLALVSSEEAHRKDLRYLTVTKATCEEDVDFVLKGHHNQQTNNRKKHNQHYYCLLSPPPFTLRH